MRRFTKYPQGYVKASADIRYMDFKGRVPKKIKDATLEYMNTDGVSLADAFGWACREYAPEGSELWKAWYNNDFRKFIPSEYDPKYLDFKKYPLKYAEPVSSSSTIKASTDNIKYYEVMFDTVPRNEEDLDGDVVGEYSICIRGTRRPSLKEAAEFCKEDMEIMSKSYGDLFVVNVAEISKEEAQTFFNMDNEESFPIFSTSTIKASSDTSDKIGRTYTAFYNGEVFEVSSNCDALIKQLKAEIDEAIADGDVEDIDFGECWVEDNDEEVMYIADGDDDYAEYL